MKSIIKHDFQTGITHIRKLKFKKISKFKLLICILLLGLICSNIYQYKVLKKQYAINVMMFNNLSVKEKKIISLQEQIDKLTVKNNKKESKKNNTKKD